jgi:4-hydroxy-4-methyl-2-oxoglutarate aldolase
MSRDRVFLHKTLPATITEFRKMMPCAAIVHETMGRKGNMIHLIKPIAQGMMIAGVAKTVVSAPGDNLMLHRALLTGKAGDVIVADCQGHYEYGYWGEFMTSVALAKGIEGLVIDGGVRDSSAIRSLGFGVFAGGIAMAGTSKNVTRTMDEPITCGGVEVSPGDLVLGDDDGVVVVPSAKATEVLAIAKDKARKERADLRSIVEGRTSYREFLRGKGWLANDSDTEEERK